MIPAPRKTARREKASEDQVAPVPEGLGASEQDRTTLVVPFRHDPRCACIALTLTPQAASLRDRSDVDDPDSIRIATGWRVRLRQ